jgi:hypothetical protein
MPTSTAAWMICAIGPMVVGRSNAFRWGRMCQSSTATSSMVVVPLAVVRWPKLDQSSITVRPLAWRSTNTITVSSASSLATTGTQWARSAPEE